MHYDEILAELHAKAGTAPPENPPRRKKVALSPDQDEDEQARPRSAVSAYTSGGMAEWYRSESRARSLYEFCEQHLGYVDMRPQPHSEMCDFLEEALPYQDDRTEQKFHLFMPPRDTFKTSIGALGLPLYFLSNFPNGRVLLNTHTQNFTRDHLQAIKSTCERNERFRTTYGNWQTDELKWAADGIIIAARTVSLKEPSIAVSGVDAPKTGGHYDLIVCDDLVSETNCLTQAARDRVYDHVENLEPMLSPGGTLLLIGTRWHEDDLYGRLIEIDKRRAREGKDPFYKKLIRGAYLPGGGLYYPTRLTEEFLTQKREKLTPRKFAIFYLNEPRESADKPFPRAELRRFQGDFVPGIVPYIQTGSERLPVFVSFFWDPAGPLAPGKLPEKADAHGLTVVGTDEAGLWYVLHAEAFRGYTSAVIDRVVSIIQRFQPKAGGLENISAQSLWGDLLARRLSDLELPPFPLRRVHPGTKRSKIGRIENVLQPRYAKRRLLLAPGLRRLEEEMDRFPDCEHDDVIDSLAGHDTLSRPAKSVERALADYALMDDEEEDDGAPRMTDGTWAGRGSMRSPAA